MGSHDWLAHSSRTAVASVAALAVARLFRMPEAYWAPITTIVVMQSTLGAAWAVSWRRLVGTVLGAIVGGIAAGYLPPGLLTFGAAVFVLGIICALLHLDHTAYRFAGVTLAIIALIPRTPGPFTVAWHRGFEVTLGIAAALAVMLLWPGRIRTAGAREPAAGRASG